MLSETKYDPPNSKPYYALWTSESNMEVQRNILLIFIQENGMDETFIKWFDENYPEKEEDNEE